MSLSASMYSGTSGLKAHGENMTVIGNNISNVSTIGYKASVMYFEDALSQTISTASGTGQIGRGVTVGTVMGDFSQGSLETTTEATDLAIGGNGFFVVSPAGQDINYYTRAGNFRFDNDGYLVDPHGYRLQGWEVQNVDTSVASTSTTTDSTSSSVQISGVPTDIKLGNFQSPPQASGHVDMILNLDSASEDKTTANGAVEDAGAYDGTPFTALFDTYDSTADPVLGDTRYAYQSTIKVYDENGTSHNLTVYFDPVADPDVTDNAGGKKYWEYIVTVPPGDDNREFWSDPANTSTQAKGILMTGTLTFSTSGELENMSAFTMSDGTVDAGDLANWTPASFSQNGYPVCTANFLGADNASYTTSTDAKNIEINFGLRNTSTTWDNDTSTLADLNTFLADHNSTAAMQTGLSDDLVGMSGEEPSALAMTNYSTGSTTVYQSQDGYTSGFLQNVSVDRDGVLTGSYSNGQVLQLYAVTLATFNNNYALYREGGNLFSETRSSGPPITGIANTGSKGSIASNSLEQSNVDLATEFVKMISVEKGFQANSKTITTVDGMLTTLIQLKR